MARYLEAYSQQPAVVSQNQFPEVAIDMTGALAGPDTKHVPGLSGADGTPQLRTPSSRSGRQDVEAQYKGLYEERMNPFADFNRCVNPQLCAVLCVCVYVCACVEEAAMSGCCRYPAFVVVGNHCRREKLKRYGNLSAAEKITLSSTRLFMASKFARTFVFFYSVGLHCLVFATLFHFTNVKHH